MNATTTFFKILPIALFLCLGLASFTPHYAGAQDATQAVIEDLNKKIQDRNQKIQQIQTEITQYKTQVAEVGKQASTLQNAIKTLDTSGKKLSSELQLTQVNIDKAHLTLQQLDLEIDSKEAQISRENAAIADAIRTMNEVETTSMIEVLLTKPDLASVWTDIATLDTVKNELSAHVYELKNTKTVLQSKQDQTAEQKRKLSTYQVDLSDKKQLVDVNKQQKATLLSQTKEQEAKYKQLLAQKQAEAQKFQNELFQFESELHIVLDKSKFAAAASSVLQWPIDHFTVTQLFGRTADAKRLYANGTHNGIDLGIPSGTPLRAALTGTVIGTGNTDLQSSCYSYGKWVLIKHNNGLSTMYAHLSLIKVVQGQVVNTGDIIGYSGQTGYATGPHLHFTVYASQGVQVRQYVSSINCKQMFIPIAAAEAYLDPMSYLPARLPTGAVR